MNRIRNVFFYLGIIVAFSFLMYLILHAGKDLETGRDVATKVTGESQQKLITQALTGNLKHPLAVLLLQIVTIILAARLFSWICRKIGQSSVIGEIAAGIVLGPSLAGMYFPEFSATLFPQQSLGNLQLLSQVGLILFMFVIGMELDLKVLKNKAHEAVVISHASIIIPFALGIGLAYFIYQSFAPPHIDFLSFGLFIGISLSITAFPVLARIVQEKNMHKTHLGTIVLTCAAVDDITAWSLLATVIAIVKAGTLLGSLPTILLGVGYVFIMVKVIRPFLARVGDLHASRENMSKSIVAIFFLVLLLSSYATEIIGIHALFGAFMAGMIMPENRKFKQIFVEKVEDVALVLLLPLFFVFTGLRTQIGLLNEPYLWKICGLVILVAVIGKFAGSALAAKFVGQSWRDSLTIGALMNTRGLVELVALNIGYDLGILTPELFSILVIMALVTTFMTAPALELIERVFIRKAKVIPEKVIQVKEYQILIAFAKPEMGRVLLRVANALTKGQSDNTVINVMHLFPGNLFNEFKIESYEQKSFAPILAESRKLKREINTIFKISEDIVADIAEEANKGQYDLLLVGVGQSIYQGTILGKLLYFATKIVNPDWLLDKFTGKEKIFDHSPFDERTRQILTGTRIPVGVLINKGLLNIDKVVVPVFSRDDAFLFTFARKLIKNSDTHIDVLDAEGTIHSIPDLKEDILDIERDMPGHIEIRSNGISNNDKLIQHDLMMTSFESWKKQDGTKSKWFNNSPTLFILKQ